MFNFFDKLKSTVSKTAQALVGNVVDAVSTEEEFSEFVLDDMEDLLEEVTFITEWPVPVVCDFSEKYLQVPGRNRYSHCKRR